MIELMKIVKEDFASFKSKAIPSFFNITSYVLLKASFRAVFLYRLSNYFDRRDCIITAYLFEKLMHITTITWIGRKAEIGPGFVIRHIGGIVVGGRVKIGSNCEIRQGVTFGGNLNKKRQGTTQPIIGNNVLFGAGAKILGPVNIGDNCIIGANAVVVCDFPKNCVVGGVPAKLIKTIKPEENPLLPTE